MEVVWKWRQSAKYAISQCQLKRETQKVPYQRPRQVTSQANLYCFVEADKVCSQSEMFTFSQADIYNFSTKYSLNQAMFVWLNVYVMFYILKFNSWTIWFLQALVTVRILFKLAVNSISWYWSTRNKLLWSYLLPYHPALLPLQIPAVIFSCKTAEHVTLTERKDGQKYKNKFQEVLMMSQSSIVLTVTHNCLSHMSTLSSRFE